MGLNVTEMDFRQYDPAIGRFYNLDPLAEQAPGWSPYRFGYNNPILFSDPTGLLERYQPIRDDNQVSINQVSGGFLDYFGNTPGSFLDNIKHGGPNGTGNGNGLQGVGSGGIYAYGPGTGYSGGFQGAMDYAMGGHWESLFLGYSRVGEVGGYRNGNEIGVNWSMKKEYASWFVPNPGAIYGIGFTLNWLGDNSISTRQKFYGATPGTSIASQYFRSRSWANNKIPRWLYNSLRKRAFGSPLRHDKWGGLLGRVTPYAGRAFVGASILMGAYNVYSAENKAEALSHEVGGFAGAMAGAELGATWGAAFGTVVPGFGTVVGGIVGGVVGGAVGYYAGSELGDGIYDGVSD